MENIENSRNYSSGNDGSELVKEILRDIDNWSRAHIPTSRKSTRVVEKEGKYVISRTKIPSPSPSPASKSRLALQRSAGAEAEGRAGTGSGNKKESVLTSGGFMSPVKTTDRKYKGLRERILLSPAANSPVTPRMGVSEFLASSQSSLEQSQSGSNSKYQSQLQLRSQYQFDTHSQNQLDYQYSRAESGSKTYDDNNIKNINRFKILHDDDNIHTNANGYNFNHVKENDIDYDSCDTGREISWRNHVRSGGDASPWPVLPVPPPRNRTPRVSKQIQQQMQTEMRTSSTQTDFWEVGVSVDAGPSIRSLVWDGESSSSMDMKELTEDEDGEQGEECEQADWSLIVEKGEDTPEIVGAEVEVQANVFVGDVVPHVEEDMENELENGLEIEAETEVTELTEMTEVEVQAGTDTNVEERRKNKEEASITPKTHTDITEIIPSGIIVPTTRLSSPSPTLTVSRHLSPRLRSRSHASLISLVCVCVPLLYVAVMCREYWINEIYAIWSMDWGQNLNFNVDFYKYWTVVCDVFMNCFVGMSSTLSEWKKEVIQWTSSVSEDTYETITEWTSDIMIIYDTSVIEYRRSIVNLMKNLIIKLNIPTIYIASKASKAVYGSKTLLTDFQMRLEEVIITSDLDEGVVENQEEFGDTTTNNYWSYHFSLFLLMCVTAGSVIFISNNLNNILQIFDIQFQNTKRRNCETSALVI